MTSSQWNSRSSSCKDGSSKALTYKLECSRLQSDFFIRQSENREIRTILYPWQYYWQYRVITMKSTLTFIRTLKENESLLSIRTIKA